MPCTRAAAPIPHLLHACACEASCRRAGAGLRCQAGEMGRGWGRGSRRGMQGDASARQRTESDPEPAPRTLSVGVGDERERLERCMLRCRQAPAQPPPCTHQVASRAGDAPVRGLAGRHAAHACGGGPVERWAREAAPDHIGRSLNLASSTARYCDITPKKSASEERSWLMLSGTASPHLIFRVYFAFANDTAPWSARSSARQHVSSSASSKSGTKSIRTE